MLEGGNWHAAALVSSVFEPFTSPMSRTSIVVMLAGWLVGGLAYRFYEAKGRSFSLRDYVRFSLPAEIYKSRSFAVDVPLLFFNHILGPARWIVGALSATVVAQAIAAALGQLFGQRSGVDASLFSTVVLVVLMVLAYDFGTYLTHRLSHALPVLWSFHRVHHSAETLNPLTLLRKHPVYDAVSVLIDCIAVAPFQALILYFWDGETSASVLLYTNVGFGIFAYAASSLRHSHIWLSFGPLLNRVFVSPALHQIHHSKAERHWDRNFGEVFAIWDWALGTLYLPKGQEKLTFGLAGEDRQPHGNLAQALLEPFAYAWRTIRRDRPSVSAEAAQ